VYALEVIVAVQIYMPQLGFSMNEGKLMEWLVGDGAMVTKGAPLYSLEADKAIEEIEAPASGRLRVIAQRDTVYPVGTLLGEIT
jgi:pyruvate/2-oxoglutarate dehydrogenase complex dihydrolipoamide acyltransferase (E2) component